MSLRAATALAVLLVAVIGLCSVPALLGGFVYDDELVKSHALFDGWENLWLAFQRTSHDYWPDMLNAASGSTYRPLPVASLVATNVLFGRQPLPHHLVSLALHTLTTAMVGLFGCDFRRYQLPPCWLFATALFALHPLVGETFLWISGRNDLLAGCTLASTALLLQARSQGVRPAQHDLSFTAACATTLSFGALCKEPFLVAATFLLVAEVATATRKRALWPALLAWAFAVIVTTRLRILAAPHARSVGSVLLDREFLLRVPHALALGLETLFVPRARPMRAFSWELEQPWTAPQLCLLVGTLGVMLWLLCRAQLRAAILLLGAAATLAPSAAVADYFWLGLDRYVHLPFILLLMAAAPLAPRLQARLDGLGPAPRRWLGTACAALLGWFALSSWSTATSFASQTEFSRALITARPADPSGYLVGAASVDDAGRQAVITYLQAMSERDLSPAFVHAVVLAQARYGLHRAVVVTLERAARNYPDNAHVRFDLLELRGAQHRFHEGLELSDGLLRDARLCPVARAKLIEWDGERALPDSVRERLRAQLRAHPCG
jgi:hypothetical protein